MNTPGFSPESLSTANELLSDYYNFARCVKPDGTAYGTKGQCKSGSPQENTEDEKRNKKVAQIGVPIPEGESAEDVLQRMLPKGAVVHRPSRLA